MRRIGIFTCLVTLALPSVVRAQTAAPPAPPAAPPADKKAPAKAEEPVEEGAVEEVPADGKEPDGAKEPEGAEDEGPKADAKHGVVTGKLVDAETKEEIIDGQCSVVNGKAKALTDAEGNFSLKLEPGTYSIRCFFEGYKTARVDNVQVVAGKKAGLKIALGKDEKKPQQDEVVVEVDPDRTTTATQMVLRKNSATVSDAVSAGDIAKTPDRNAADASKRVVGVSVVDGRFIYVRGLGDRYTNSLLNGTPLPSPEPDMAAIPLDIFPVAVLSDVTIYKSFTPDMPGDFAGGSVRISTRTFPQRFFFSSSFSGGYNTQTTFKNRTTYEGSNGDVLASDSGSRRIPKLIGQSSGKIGGPKEWMEVYGESLSQKPRRLYDVMTGPNFSVSATAGDTHTVFGNPLGWIASIGYGRRYSQHAESVQTYESTEDDTGKVTLAPRIDFTGTRSTAMTSLSGLGALGYQLGQNHRLTLNGLYTANAEDDVLQFQGFSKNDDGLLTIERARWVQRKLYFSQLLGEHKFPALKGALLKWNGFYGTAKRGEPNNVQSVYQVARDAEPGTLAQAKSGDGLTHFYSGQSEVLKGAGLDWTQPLTRASSEDGGAKLKAGALLQDKTRSFAARRFRYTYLRTPGQLGWLQTAPDRILDRDTIGRYAEVEENTRTTDAYKAEQTITAGYLMGDVPVGRFRFIGGARLEYTNLKVTSRNDLEAGSPTTVDGFKSSDWLPALGVVYKLTDAQNLRLSATQTIARPQFREVARFDYADFFNAQQVTGNPDLKRSKITNLDLRWEWFPAADEVIAVSVFYKHFADPIESTFVLATSQTFRKPINTQAAKNLGVELEGRKNLGFLGKHFAPFTVLANLILVDSQVTIGDSQLGAATSKERPLQGQSPWVVNAALDYVGNKAKTRARVSYNVFGRRIDTVGTMRVPDTYEMPRHSLDVSVSQQLAESVDVKLSVENLLNAAYRFQTGDLPAGEWRLGQTFWLSVIHTL